jgi:hypothetical protein
MSTSQAAQIASTIVSFLAPFTPHLVKGAEKATEVAGKKLGELGGEAIWEEAQAIWDKITNRFKDDEETQSAATSVTRQPESETRQKTLAKILAERLKDDPALVKELAALVGEMQEIASGSIVVSGSGAVATQDSAAGGEGSIGAGGDVHISAGDLPKDDEPLNISGVGMNDPESTIPDATAEAIADTVINDRPTGNLVWTSDGHTDPTPA